MRRAGGHSGSHSPTTPRAGTPRGLGAIACGVLLLAIAGGVVYGVWWLRRDHPAPVSTGQGEARAAQVRTYRSTMGDAFLDVRLALDRSEMNVAERLDLRLTAQARSGASITLPTIGEKLGDFSVAAVERSERQVSPETKEVTLHAVLEPFLAGDKAVPAMEVKAVDGTTKLTAKTEAVAMLVVAVVPGATETTPLEPALAPVEWPVAGARRVAWVAPVAIGAVIACLLAGGVVAVRRRRGHAIDPVARAHERIEAVRLSAPGASLADAAALAAELHAAFASYLEHKWRIPATTRTPGEVHASVVAHGDLPPDARQEIGALLVELERTRFAPDAATGPVVERLAGRCLGVIDRVAHLDRSGVAA